MPVPTVDSTGAWRALEHSAVFDCFPELIGFGSTTGCLDFYKEECHVCTVLQQYTRLNRKLSVLTGQTLSKKMFLPIIWAPKDLLNHRGNKPSMNSTDVAHQPNLCLNHCIKPRFQPIHAACTSTKIRRRKQAEQQERFKEGIKQLGLNSALFTTSFVTLGSYLIS